MKIYTQVKKRNVNEDDSMLWVAYGKYEPFLHDVNKEGFVFEEPGDLHFEFGSTPEEATESLIKEMRGEE